MNTPLPVDPLYAMFTSYTSKFRQYHNINHIAEALMNAQKLKKDLDLAQVHAIMFHDIVYDFGVPAGQNERKSAEEAAKYLKEMGYPDEHVEDVCSMIEATAKVLGPEVPDLSVREWTVCGLDLYPLGTTEAAKHAVSLRQEMSHLDFSAWRTGREKFFLMMLSKKYIIDGSFFLSKADYERWHNMVKTNIYSELADLFSRDEELLGM